MDSYQGSHGLATLSCWIGDEAGQKSGGLVLGKQHGNGEEKDSRKVEISEKEGKGIAIFFLWEIPVKCYGNFGEIP